jgi:hypothetical protein
VIFKTSSSRRVLASIILAFSIGPAWAAADPDIWIPEGGCVPPAQPSSKAAAALSVPVAQAVTLLRNGPPRNRIDVIYLAEGYTSAELARFAGHAAEAIAYKDSAEIAQPYKRYRKFFNYYRADLPSPESGIDEPEKGISRNTALDGLGEGRLGTVNDSKARAAATEAMRGLGIQADWVNAVLNTPDYYNSGGPICVFAHPFYGEIALHEGGHAFHRLADEYGGTGTYGGGEPREINVTADPTGAKWKTWVGYQQPMVGANGAFEGGRYFDKGCWRPSQNSKMNITSHQRPAGFNMPSIEKIILDIYAKVRPVDSSLPTATPLKDPESLWVAVVDSEVIKVDWLVDGSAFKADHGGVLHLGRSPIPLGTHKVKARVYDALVTHANSDNARPHALDWIRRDLDKLQQELEWTVEVTRVVSALNRPPARRARPAFGGDGLRFELRRDGPYRLTVLTAEGAVVDVLRGSGRAGPEVLPWPSALRQPRTLFLRVD